MPKIPEEEKRPDLNMTPMIDIVFQLLIFFMLSMHFKEVEGKLITTLPKDKGLQSSSVLQPELQEVRVILCAGGDVRMHSQNKGEHERVDKDPTVCKAMVEKIDVGDLHKTSKDESKIAPNRAIYKQIGAKTKELYDMTPSSRDPSKRSPIIIDADSETPYEHIIGVINVLKEVDIENIEFAGNPRFGTTYGSGQKDQFNRKK